MYCSIIGVMRAASPFAVGRARPLPSGGAVMSGAAAGRAASMAATLADGGRAFTGGGDAAAQSFGLRPSRVAARLQHQHVAVADDAAVGKKAEVGLGSVASCQVTMASSTWRA